MKEEKVYFVKFNDYTNSTYSTVRYSNIEEGQDEYLDIPYGGLVIRESELEKYRKFGNGYKTIKLVGSMYFKEN